MTPMKQLAPGIFLDFRRTGDVENPTVVIQGPESARQLQYALNFAKRELAGDPLTVSNVEIQLSPTVRKIYEAAQAKRDRKRKAG